MVKYWVKKHSCSLAAIEDGYNLQIERNYYYENTGFEGYAGSAAR